MVGGHSIAAGQGILAIGAMLTIAVGCGRVGYEPLFGQNDDNGPDNELDAAGLIDASTANLDATIGLDASSVCTDGLPPFGCIQQSSGLRFDGTDQVEIPHAPELNLGTGDSTTEAWIRSDVTTPATHTVLSKRDVGDIGSGFMFGLLLGGGVWTQYAGAPNHFSNAPNLLDDQWHHIAAVRESISPTSGQILLYVDGALVLTVPSTPLAETSTTSPVLIGADANTSPAFLGVVHNVRMWSVARTQTEIETARFLPLTGTETGLLGAWPLDEGTGQVAADVRGANPGSLGSASGPDDSDPIWVSIP